MIEKTMSMRARLSFAMFALAFCGIGGAVYAQTPTDAPSSRSGFSLATGIGDFAGDFALGGAVQSPLFFDALALRLTGFCAWRPGVVSPATTESWTPYFVGEAGLVGASALLGDYLRVYGSGGLTIVAATEGFSSGSILFGGFGVFGFEFFPGGPLCYFIELGSHGIGARADKMSASPIYLNGFSTQVGLRFYF